MSESMLKAIREQRDIIRSWQHHAERMGKLLGCMGIDKDIEEAATSLRAELTAAKGEIERLRLQTSIAMQEGVYGTEKCPLCDNREMHRHTKEIERGLGAAVALSSIHSLHRAAATLGHMFIDAEQVARSAVLSEAKEPE